MKNKSNIISLRDYYHIVMTERHDMFRFHMNNEHYRYFFKCNNRKKTQTFKDLSDLGYTIIRLMDDEFEFSRWREYYKKESLIHEKFKYGTFVLCYGYVAFANERDATKFLLIS